MRVLVTFFLILLLALPVRAQQGMTLVRDAEIEAILYRWCAPMWEAAGLAPENVKIVMIQDSDLNAFTAGGQLIFVTTGLLMRAERPDEIVGVMAHETGHIVGGHILNQKAQGKFASYESIVSYILGAGVGILSGNGQIGNAIILSGQASALNRYLAHSRLEESSADQAGVSFLRQAGLPATGLMTFLGKLQDQELLPPSQQQGYARTHPVTRDRIEALRSRIDDAPSSAKGDMKGLERMQAKLLAFTTPSRAQEKYAKDESTIGVMARAIVAYRQGRTDEALRLVKSWQEKEPKNPFVYELQGQILKEAGRPREAVGPYRKALELAPRASLIRIDAAHAMIESHDDALLDPAIDNLKAALRDESRNSFALRLLSTAYGRKGMEPEAQIALAEMSLLRNDHRRARELMAIAWPRLSSDSPMRRQASDLKLQLDSLPEDD